MNIANWVNLAKYTPLELVFFSIGGFFWVVCYAEVLRNIRRYGVIEIPAGAVVANMAWETTWAILFVTDLGAGFVWGYRTWFVLDLFIFYYLWKSGAKHVTNPALVRIARPAIIVGYLSWLAMLYLFVLDGHDTPNGLTTGFIVTLMMSALYVRGEVRGVNPDQFSALAAWSKLLGNGGASVFVFMAMPDLHFLQSVCVLTFILDVAYLVIFYRRIKPLRTRSAAA